MIVSFNTRDVTRTCLQTVYRCADELSFEVIVVDNASTDGSADMIAREFEQVRLIRLEENRGFAGGNIPGMRQAAGRHVLLLNSDAFLSAGALSQSVAHMDAHPQIGILGCRLTNPDGSLQPSARTLPGPLNKILHITGLAARYPHSKFFGRVDYAWWDHATPRSVGWVVGAFFLVRREVIEAIGPLDDRYFLYFEEIDYCLSARRAGWDVVFFPGASVVHLGGQSSAGTGVRLSAKGRQMIAIRIKSEFRYYRKLYGRRHVLAAAGIEFFWNGVVYLRNRLRRSSDAARKRQDARTLMGLILKTLWQDRLGGGAPPPGV